MPVLTLATSSRVNSFFDDAVDGAEAIVDENSDQESKMRAERKEGKK